ncbi:PREDICTED: uncharacterized protein K02A2.6-like [Rhagoletis zephyria]|uniref:uncharacterized protein K02A2.6-like n=1 Tax=Rhagoletis zephyria TaxID=28612 RepID=UPI000811A612|nr:PREDICTED: uncharacterized protein K02A2.6-like [Rhagoletis zephyria]
MKQLARKNVTWNGIDLDIELTVRGCESCAKVMKAPPKVAVHHWEEPTGNFQRVHIDYGGPFMNHNFLVLVDAKSKLPEVRVLKDAPSTQATIDLLKNIFYKHGTPQIIVSENATIFTSLAFTEFCHANGIIQKFIAPGHPATNGLAERYVQPLNSKLKSMEDDATPLNEKVQEILLHYRATPLACGDTPAKLYLGREIRIKLDAIRPNKHKKSIGQTSHGHPISVGDRLQARSYGGGKSGWKFGVATAKRGHLHYEVLLDSGYKLKRHINQLNKTNVD